MTAPRDNEPAAAAAGAYQVVARRFRPRTFQELVGQEEVVKSLRAALDSGKVPHAFLFSGSRGVGKTTVARILARALNCEKGVSSSPCGTCERCQAILAESDPDVIEIDAASRNGVDDIRELREKAGYAPMRGRRKVYILDEVHMLSRGAFNAFLKILEEPPAHVTFVLATTEIHKVPETIRSRCQVHLFRRAGEAGIQERLRQICATEGAQVDPRILADIARSCRGSLRDAESALERILPLLRAGGTAFTLDDYRRNAGRMGLDRVAQTLGTILAGDGAAALAMAADAAATGVDERECLGEVLEILRTLLHLKIDGKDSLLVPFEGELRAALWAIAETQTAARLEAAIQLAVLGRDRIRRLDDRQLLLELTLLRMARLGELADLRTLLDRLETGPAAPAAASGAAGARPAPLPVVTVPRPAGAPATAPARVPAAPAATVAAAAGPGPALQRAAPAAPAPAATAPAATPAASGDPLAPLAEGWPERLLAALRDRLPIVADAFQRARAELVEGGATVRIHLPSLPRMARDRLEQPASQEALRDAGAASLGRPARLVLVFTEGGSAAQASAALPAAGPGADPPPAAPASAAQGPGPLAEKVRKRFDGRFVDPA